MPFGEDQSRALPGKEFSEATSETTRLAGLAREGDRHAFEELMGVFHRQIFRLVSYRTGSRMDAEDLTQEIFLSAYRGLSGLKDPDRFKQWLYRIALNRVRDFHRKKRFLLFLGLREDEEVNLPEIREADEDAQGWDGLEKKQFWQAVGRFTKNLAPGEREVFMLRFLDQQTIKEIALILKKSESAVKTHLYRGLKKFRENDELVGILEGGRR